MGNPFLEESKYLLVLDTISGLSGRDGDGDMDQFFSHENHACPPSLSQEGKLRLGSKADIMLCLEV